MNEELSKEMVEAKKPLPQWFRWTLISVGIVAILAVAIFFAFGRNDIQRDQGADITKNEADTSKQTGAKTIKGEVSSQKSNPASNIDADNPPKFVQADFVELDKVYMISKFRSGDGHDFSVGSGETCRSMKHYFSSMDVSQPDYKQEGGMNKSAMPMPTVDKDVKIFSPVDGTLSAENFDQVAFDQELDLVPDKYPELRIRLMHVQLAPNVVSGTKVKAGDMIGLVLANQSFDLAIDFKNGSKGGFISYFAAMPDDIFAKYQARGVGTREDLITTKAYRDAHPFECVSGTEQFVSSYAQEDPANNLVYLSGYQAISDKMNVRYKK